MRRLLAALEAAARTDVTVTLVGETGTGKELLARRVHATSPRAHAPFIALNCAAIPETLFESELFGHERGAFTGASQNREGKIEAARGGTLMLDEIGELPHTQQAKLLRFLEHRQFMRVGGTRKIAANVRVVCATLRPLEQEVAAGRFRADLFYRIQGVSFVVPPLSERREDIVDLIEHFLASIPGKHGLAPPKLTRSARALLLAHSWPGNVRELRSVIERGCLFRAGRTIRAEDLPEALRRSTSRPRGRATSAARTLDEIIREAVSNAVRRAGGALEPAAAELGISVRTLQRYRRAGKAP
ncbi:MAG: sigma 54-interacting transcriptional regulator [Polyangiales bacterium]